MDLSDDAQAAFEARIVRLRRIQIRLMVIGAALTVLSPLIAPLAISIGLEWMRWFWVISIGTFAVGGALAIGTARAEWQRWRRAVLELARLDQEQERSSQS